VKPRITFVFKEVLSIIFWLQCNREAPDQLFFKVNLLFLNRFVLTQVVLKTLPVPFLIEPKCYLEVAKMPILNS